MKVAVCKEPKKPLVFEEWDMPEINDDEVLIQVHYCGVCHSDLHIVDGDWADWVSYPTVPGHEVAGIAVKVGKEVTWIKEGDRVGMPWIYSSCEVCNYCVEGDEPLCPNQEITGITKQGGYAEYMKAPGRFVTKIPDNLDLAHAAPLFCAGVTVYAALKHLNIKPDELVAVQGVGGLGHLAIQYAKAMGAKVAALSHSQEKEEFSGELGADYFINTSKTDPAEELKKLGGADVILTTVFKSEAIQTLIGGLAPRGRLSVVGAARDPIQVIPFDLITKRIVVTGSAVGGRKLLRETLQFSADFGIKPLVEIHPFDKVNEVLDRVREGKVRLRAVLKMV
ncbi:propanol-preferring alcohol dehydrogenase [Hydrogenivirga caldilitoris]|uniref:Propanol-preferring alcohol dehydrogenase n=1 Tax=Hydrogenivirga caldilitoris TaxID=246264 RepID=A0A497XQT3_9AQUI|nr:alcohol dehydrogenase catalytic domain-containing protein [Hydrogenivirga caldilitoris]RLJ70520.1 propanol-preferring alcohol dehydrogenase [Hydrogenivirga caldilitoris]